MLDGCTRVGSRLSCLNVCDKALPLLAGQRTDDSQGLSNRLDDDRQTAVGYGNPGCNADVQVTRNLPSVSPAGLEPRLRIATGADVAFAPSARGVSAGAPTEKSGPWSENPCLLLCELFVSERTGIA